MLLFIGPELALPQEQGFFGAAPSSLSAPSLQPRGSYHTSLPSNGSSPNFDIFTSMI